MLVFCSFILGLITKLKDVRQSISKPLMLLSCLLYLVGGEALCALHDVARDKSISALNGHTTEAWQTLLSQARIPKQQAEKALQLYDILDKLPSNDDVPRREERRQKFREWNTCGDPLQRGISKIFLALNYGLSSAEEARDFFQTYFLLGEAHNDGAQFRRAIEMFLNMPNSDSSNTKASYLFQGMISFLSLNKVDISCYRLFAEEVFTALLGLTGLKQEPQRVTVDREFHIELVKSLTQEQEKLRGDHRPASVERYLQNEEYIRFLKARLHILWNTLEETRSDHIPPELLVPPAIQKEKSVAKTLSRFTLGLFSKGIAEKSLPDYIDTAGLGALSVHPSDIAPTLQIFKTMEWLLEIIDGFGAFPKPGSSTLPLVFESYRKHRLSSNNSLWGTDYLTQVQAYFMSVIPPLPQTSAKIAHEASDSFVMISAASTASSATTPAEIPLETSEPHTLRPRSLLPDLETMLGVLVSHPEADMTASTETMEEAPALTAQGVLSEIVRQTTHHSDAFMALSNQVRVLTQRIVEATESLNSAMQSSAEDVEYAQVYIDPLTTLSEHSRTMERELHTKWYQFTDALDEITSGMQYELSMQKNLAIDVIQRYRLRIHDILAEKLIANQGSWRHKYEEMARELEEIMPKVKALEASIAKEDQAEMDGLLELITQRRREVEELQLKRAQAELQILEEGHGFMAQVQQVASYLSPWSTLSAMHEAFVGFIKECIACEEPAGAELASRAISKTRAMEEDTKTLHQYQDALAQAQTARVRAIFEVAQREAEILFKDIVSISTQISSDAPAVQAMLDNIPQLVTAYQKRLSDARRIGEKLAHVLPSLLTNIVKRTLWSPETLPTGEQVAQLEQSVHAALATKTVQAQGAEELLEQNLAMTRSFVSGIAQIPQTKRSGVLKAPMLTTNAHLDTVTKILEGLERHKSTFAQLSLDVQSSLCNFQPDTCRQDLTRLKTIRKFRPRGRLLEVGAF